MLDAKSYVNLSNASLFFWAWLIGLLKGLRTYLLLIKEVEGLSRYNLMKWHISSWLFIKLDDFLPFVIYMVDVNVKTWFFIKIGYHIVPSPSTTLKETELKDILQHAIKYATFFLLLEFICTLVLQLFLPDWLIDCFVIQLFVNRGSTDRQGLRQKKRIAKQYIWLYSPLDEIKHNKSL